MHSGVPLKVKVSIRVEKYGPGSDLSGPPDEVVELEQEEQVASDECVESPRCTDERG